MAWGRPAADGRGERSSTEEAKGMNLAAIMVTVDFEPISKARISLAADLARRFGSLLIGVAGWPLIKRPVETLSDSELAERALKELRNLGERFRKIAENVAVRVEWRSSMDFPRELIPKEARAADLLVIGQRMLPGDVVHSYDPGTIVLAAGRPVLVVPPEIDRLDLSRVLVAWKDTREARRAIRDALPFLKLADEVSIAVAKTPGAEEADAQLADVASYLGRHDVRVGQQIATVASDDEEHLLLDLAKQHRVSLIVAGAYGRTRLSEWIFGGVTRHLLLNSPVPCLLSN
jgi:nucleotide-binding universal stress UspA family protein